MANSPLESFGERGMIERSQSVRLIIQSLCSLGFSGATSTLEYEPGSAKIHWNVPLSPPQPSPASGRAASPLSIQSPTSTPTRSRPPSSSSGKNTSWKKLLPERISTLDLDGKKVHRLARALIDMEGAVRMEDRGKRRMGLLMELVGLMPDWIRGCRAGGWSSCWRWQ